MTADERLQDLVDRLLVKDHAAHEEAIDALAGEGDERVAPHLLEVATMHAVATDWEAFGFPEVLRDDGPPRSLTHPEVRWPGAIDALRAVAEPDFDGPAAWLRWEAWLTGAEVEPLAGFDDWKLRLFRRFHPLVGDRLDVDPPLPSLSSVRWGNTDPASLHPLHAAGFVAGDDADYLREEDLVFGFTVDDRAHAVPRFVVFPHELLATELAGVPLALTYCTMCNSPLLYDRRLGDRTLTFGSTGCLRDGNKLMYDEETGSLWAQHRGVPVAGPLSTENVSLDILPVTQTTWAEWRADHPDGRALDRETGYDWDYERYRDYDGFIARHYWSNPDVTHPGVVPADDRLDDKTPVYGVDDGPTALVFPIATVREAGALTATLGDRAVVATTLEGDVAVFEAPSTPIAAVDEGVEDADGTRWAATTDGLVAPDGRRRPRLPGRHGLWLAFRTAYDSVEVVGVD